MLRKVAHLHKTVFALFVNRTGLMITGRLALSSTRGEVGWLCLENMPLGGHLSEVYWSRPSPD